MRYPIGLAVVLLAACSSVTPVEYQPAGPVAKELAEMVELLERAEQSARAASRARNVAGVKARVDEVFAVVWGIDSGLGQGAEAVHGWKTRWQARFTDFDAAYGERYGALPPEVGETRLLGIVGRGRALRQSIEAASPSGRDAVLAPLNNVIGWMRLDDGVTKAERQPRIDLTYMWDAGQSFWLSDADTGWIFKVQAQALNILKSDYAGDVRLARRHADDLAVLVRQCLDGADEDGDGLVRPVPMEGGLTTAQRSAMEAGI